MFVETVDTTGLIPGDCWTVEDGPLPNFKNRIPKKTKKDRKQRELVVPPKHSFYTKIWAIVARWPWLLFQCIATDWVNCVWTGYICCTCWYLCSMSLKKKVLDIVYLVVCFVETDCLWPWLREKKNNCCPTQTSENDSIIIRCRFIYIPLSCYSFSTTGTHTICQRNNKELGRDLLLPL